MSFLLAVSAGLAGALVGFVLGVLAAATGLQGAPESLAALVVAVAVVLDLAGRPRPPSVARQVPRSWARLFPLRVAAVLYGARLGVGPFTILSTWLWWAAVVMGAAAGPWWSVATGAAFGVGRVLVMTVVAARIEGDAVARMAAVRDRERVVRRAALAGAVLAAAALLAACTGGGDRKGDGGDAGRGAPSSTTTAAPGEVVAGGEAGAATGALADVLLGEVGPDYQRVPDDARPGLGLLDLEAAARAELDTSAERALLTTRGYRAGMARAWRNQAGDELYQAVYEFGDEAGAAAYLKDGLITLEGRAAELYPVEGIPGASGFSQAERRPAGAVTSHGLVFVRGHRFFLVFASSARPGTTPAHVAEVGRAADARQATGSAAPS